MFLTLTNHITRIHIIYTSHMHIDIVPKFTQTSVVTDIVPKFTQTSVVTSLKTGPIFCVWGLPVCIIHAAMLFLWLSGVDL